MRASLALAATTLLLAGATAANSAQAHNVSISIDAPYWGVRIGTPVPAYPVYAPAPVIVVPAPVYPRPVLVALAPIVVAPPVVYAPPRVVVPAPVLYGPPVYGPPGHRYRIKDRHVRHYVRY
jgi:hypothetical protein